MSEPEEDQEQQPQVSDEAMASAKTQEERLKRLERENRLLKWGVVIALVGVVAIVLTTWLPPLSIRAAFKLGRAAEMWKKHGPTPAQTSPPATAKEPNEPVTAERVLQYLKTRGLPIGESEVYTAETDPNQLLGRPGQYISKVNFRDTRLKKEPPPDIPNQTPEERARARGDALRESGGSIEVFGNPADAQTRKEYLEAGRKLGPFFMWVEYTYQQGNILLRLSNHLTPAQTAEYEKALRGLGGGE